MAGINKVILVGRLGKDPEIRATQSEKKNALHFQSLQSETWVNNGNKEERTEWHRIVAWERLAELAEKYLKRNKYLY